MLTPPLLGVATMAAQVGLASLGARGAIGELPGAALLLPTFMGSRFDIAAEFVTVTARAHLAQVVWLAAAAATGLLILAADDPHSSTVDTLATRALEALHNLPAAEQRSRVAAFREAELGCADGDRLEILVGPAGPR